MKLIEDDGTVIEELPDDLAMLIVRPDRTMRALMPPRQRGEEVPLHSRPWHARLVIGLVTFLQYRSAVEAVMRHAPTTRNDKHRHH